MQVGVFPPFSQSMWGESFIYTFCRVWLLSTSQGNHLWEQLMWFVQVQISTKFTAFLIKKANAAMFNLSMSFQISKILLGQSQFGIENYCPWKWYSYLLIHSAYFLKGCLYYWSSCTQRVFISVEKYRCSKNKVTYI